MGGCTGREATAAHPGRQEILVTGAARMPARYDVGKETRCVSLAAVGRWRLAGLLGRSSDRAPQRLLEKHVRHESVVVKAERPLTDFSVAGQRLMEASREPPSSHGKETFLTPDPNPSRQDTARM